jgi:hypothetical protein
MMMDSSTHPQYMKVIKHLAYVHHGCGNQQEEGGLKILAEVLNFPGAFDNLMCTHSN